MADNFPKYTPTTFAKSCSLTSQIQYRTELFAGQGYRDPVQVMTFETCELGNNDILEYLAANTLKNHPIREDLQDAAKFEMGECEIEDLFNRVIDAIHDVTGIHVQYVLWLTSLEEIREYYWPMACGDYAYVNGESDKHTPLNMEDVDAYQVGPVILSDLGREGRLYGYPAKPAKVQF